MPKGSRDTKSVRFFSWCCLNASSGSADLACRVELGDERLLLLCCASPSTGIPVKICDFLEFVD